jgi:DNA polymerase III subunit gamma/tau
MGSQVLYLKWRPQRFEDVIGQEHVTQTLRNGLRAGRIAHAYLFSGPRGTGKTTMARLLAKAVNCLDEDVSRRPCNRCAICEAVNEGRLLDLIEMDAASHTGVDNVREAIRDKVGFRPTQARYKVYVIDEVHMLSTSAFNALLKTLEEPPEHVIMILATTEPHKVLPTILSRCQQFDFRRIPVPILVTRLRTIADQEGIRVEDQALQFMARASSGCARDAISLLDQLTAYGDEVITVGRLHQVLGLGDAQMVHELVVHTADYDAGSGLALVNRAVEAGADVRQFAQQVVEYLRNLLLLRVGSDAALLDVDAETHANLSALVGRVSVHELLRWIKLFNQAQLDLRGSDQSHLGLELAFVEAATPEQEPSAAVPALPAAQPAPEHVEVKASAEPRPRATGTASPPAAPSRSGERTDADREQETSSPEQASELSEAELPLASVAPAEVTSNWVQIRHIIKEQSRQIEALVNSAVIRGIEDRNRVVFEFASDFLASKLEKEETKRVVEQAISSVLGRPCRARGATKGSLPSAGAVDRAAVGREGAPAGESAGDERQEPRQSQGASTPSSSAAESAEPIPGSYEEAVSDPVVQDLIRHGGQVTDVQTLPEQ